MTVNRATNKLWQRPSRNSLISDIMVNYHYYSFNQVVRILGLENIKFKTKLRLDPATNIIDNISIINNKNKKNELEHHYSYTVTVNYFTLTGIAAPLPIHYTEKINQMHPSDKRAVTDFLDIFSGRLLQLSFQIKRKYLIGLSDNRPHESNIVRLISAFANHYNTSYELNKLSTIMPLITNPILVFTQPKSLSGVEIFLQMTYGIDIKIIPFVGRWKKFDHDQTTILGKSRLSTSTKDKINSVNSETFLGDRAWIQNDLVEIVLGPITQEKMKLLKENNIEENIKIQMNYLLPTHIDYRLVYDIIDPPSTDDELFLGHNSFLAPH